MSNYYLDTSALVKGYLVEIGSTWVSTLVAATAGNVIVLSDLTSVELFSTLARRQCEGTLIPANALVLQTRFQADLEREYLSIPLETVVLNHARNLLARYPLRSLDALQLACALEAVSAVGEPMMFVSSDNNLLAAAIAEGFHTDNPNLHP